MLTAVRFCLLLTLPLLPNLVRAAPPAEGPGRYFAIEVVDDQTGRGVPMVELQTTSSVSYYTDSSGLIAFSSAGLRRRAAALPGEENRQRPFANFDLLKSFESCANRRQP